MTLNEKIEQLHEQIEDLKTEELERIKSELEPHFEKYGKLVITDDRCINLLHNGEEFTILYISTNGYFDNDYVGAYNKTGINRDDVFEKVLGLSSLDEIKIKPVKRFSVKKWKKEFAERYGLDYKFDNVYTTSGDLVISEYDNVNFRRWHNNAFRNKHTIFEFDGSTIALINNQRLADEFERVFVIMRDYLEKIEKEKPELNLNKGDDDDQYV